MTFPKSISSFPIHLGLGAVAEALPEFTGEMSWYEYYSQRCAIDGNEGRLVSLHSFDAPWNSWEMHPAGSEVVVCISGAITLHQEDQSGARQTVLLNSGEYAINQAGIWHTADVVEPTTVLFITSGLGTQHRARTT